MSRSHPPFLLVAAAGLILGSPASWAASDAAPAVDEPAGVEVLSESGRRYYAAFGLAPDAADYAAFAALIVEAGQLEEGRAYFEAAARLDPEFDVARFGLASLSLEAGNDDEAIALLREIADRKGALAPRAYLMLAEIARMQGRAGRALEYSERSLELDPDQPDVLVNIGIAKLRQGDEASAEPLFVEVIRQRPDALMARLYLGRIYARTERVDEARTLFEEMLAIDARNPYALFNLGQLESRDGNPIQANRYYQSALQNARKRGEVALAKRIQRSLVNL